MIVAHVEAMDDWSRIFERDCPLVIEERAQPLRDADIAPLLVKAPFAIRAEGELDTLAEQLAELPLALVTDVEALAIRFAELTGNNTLRIRIEGVTTNACKKVHADYTDVRLITTYAGPGTDFAPHGDGDCCLERMSVGGVGLFKGRLFAPDHNPCFHRSPPIEGSGEARLVLVIDTPARDMTG